METVDPWLEEVAEIFKTQLKRTWDHHNQSNIILEELDTSVKIIEAGIEPFNWVRSVISDSEPDFVISFRGTAYQVTSYIPAKINGHLETPFTSHHPSLCSRGDFFIIWMPIQREYSSESDLCFSPGLTIMNIKH